MLRISVTTFSYCAAALEISVDNCPTFVIATSASSDCNTAPEDTSAIALWISSADAVASSVIALNVSDDVRMRSEESLV